MKDGAVDNDASRSVSSSLLERIKLRQPDAWSRIVQLYYPLVRDWCQRAGLQAEDAAEVAQEVFRALAGNVDRFNRDGGSNTFRGWLRGITKRQLLAFWRHQKEQPIAAGGTTAQLRFAQIAAADVEEPSTADMASERMDLVRRALALVKADVEEHNWQAFWRVVVDGHAPADVAADLGISVNTVYLAKGRLLRRLREEFGGLL
jgi:RNA polymerase sigma-70 factor, ECF subfamily